MGKCSSKRAAKEDFSEHRLNGLLKSKQCSPIFVTITNNYGNVSITEEDSPGKTYSDGKDVKSKDKANSLEIEENKQQRDNDFEHSIYSNTKTSFDQEPSYTSNNNITNTKFERVRDDYCENYSTLSGIEMLNLKASIHVGEDCYPVEDTYKPSKSFQSDIQKNVHFAREDITQRVVNGKTHRHVDSDYERSPESRCTKKYHSEGSGVNFSILSEHRSFCPADGEETSPEQVNELCNTNMIQLNQLVPDCCDNINESQSSLPPQDSFRYSFSRSVTGYPDGTDSYESGCFDSVNTFDDEYSKSSLQLSTHSWNDVSASAMTANDQCGQFLNNTCLYSDSKDKACKDTVNNLGFQTTSSVDDKVCSDYAQNNLVVRSSYRFSDSFSQDSLCEQTAENQSNNCDQDGIMEKYAELCNTNMTPHNQLVPVVFDCDNVNESQSSLPPQDSFRYSFSRSVTGYPDGTDSYEEQYRKDLFESDCFDSVSTFNGEYMKSILQLSTYSWNDVSALTTNDQCGQLLNDLCLSSDSKDKACKDTVNNLGFQTTSIVDDKVCSDYAQNNLVVRSSYRFSDSFSQDSSCEQTAENQSNNCDQDGSIEKYAECSVEHATKLDDYTTNFCVEKNSNEDVTEDLGLGLSVKIDSGISSGSDTSILFLQKITDIKHNFSKMKKTSSMKEALHKVTLKKINSGKFLCQGKVRFTEFRNVTRNVCARERQRQIAKAIARELYVDERNFTVFGLGSYFDRLNNGPLPSAQEQMQYEWLRLATLSTYTGNGNTLALARNGFFHDNNEGPTYTRCYLCNAHHSCWEMFDDVAEQHRQQSPNCPFVTNRDQDGLNISITPAYHDNASRPTSTSTASTTSVPTVTVVTNASSNSEAAINEVERNLRRSNIGQHQHFHNDEESIPQQPTYDPESRDRSLLALSQASTQRALGRSGHSFSTIIAPRRNNVAMGARSNVGIETSSSGSTSTGTPSQPSGIRLSSDLGGPVGAGAFSGLNSATQRPQLPVSTATESSQGSSVTTPTTTHTSQATGEAAVGPGAEGRTDPTTTVVYHPKHPDYLNVNKRIDSYTGWPDYLDQTPRQMAEAGFFYVGVADFTRCFCCGGGLRNWEPGDDPMLEHTRWFPRCEYVVRLKGERYVSAVQRRHQEQMAEQQRQQVELARSRDETSNPPDPLDTEAAAAMREMGYSEGRTREAVLAVRQQTGSSLVTTPQVLTWLLDDEERQLDTSENSVSDDKARSRDGNHFPNTTFRRRPKLYLNPKMKYGKTSVDSEGIPNNTSLRGIYSTDDDSEDSGISSMIPTLPPYDENTARESLKMRKNKAALSGKTLRKTLRGLFRKTASTVCTRARRRQIAKAFARELHVDERNFTVFGLGSYFDRLNNGPQPSAQEQMQYEWLRLATFSTYTGNGNALALARNGFYHDHNEGPTYTRCYLCNAHHSYWDIVDDVGEQHRQQSPNCPFVTNRDQGDLNISITPEDHGNASMSTRNSTATTSSAPIVTAGSRSSSNADTAVNEVERNMRRTNISQHEAFSNRLESILHQPTGDLEGIHHSLPESQRASTQRSHGCVGNPFSSIISPSDRNNGSSRIFESFSWIPALGHTVEIDDEDFEMEWEFRQIREELTDFNLDDLGVRPPHNTPSPILGELPANSISTTTYTSEVQQTDTTTCLQTVAHTSQRTDTTTSLQTVAHTSQQTDTHTTQQTGIHTTQQRVNNDVTDDNLRTSRRRSSESASNSKSLKAENEKLRAIQTCKICMEQPVDTTLLPCGHLVCCENCAARLVRCPICRKRIESTLKTFMS